MAVVGSSGESNGKDPAIPKNGRLWSGKHILLRDQLKRINQSEIWFN